MQLESREWFLARGATSEDVHVVGRNASQTNPAKFVVVFLKDKSAPVLVPTGEN